MSEAETKTATADVDEMGIWWFCPLCGSWGQVSQLTDQTNPGVVDSGTLEPVPIWVGFCTWCGAHLRLVGRRHGLIAQPAEYEGIKVEGCAHGPPPKRCVCCGQKAATGRCSFGRCDGLICGDCNNGGLCCACAELVVDGLCPHDPDAKREAP